MKRQENLRNNLAKLKKRVEIRKNNGYIFNKKQVVTIENDFYNDLKVEVYKTI